MASENSLNLVHDIGTLSDDVVRTVRRPYKCTFCIKTFTVHSNLVKHTRTHTGERPFKCEVCEKAFANPSNLTRHRRLHAGIRPYTCGFCQKGFRDRSNLKYHLKTHLKDTSFKCPECGDVFNTFSNYCAHMKIHFDITSELLYKSSFPSPHTKASTSETDALMNKNPASETMKLLSSSSSFPSFMSSNSHSNEETSEELLRLSMLAASSFASDVQNNNNCDITSLNESLVNRHQNFSSFENKNTQGIMGRNGVIQSLHSADLSKDFSSNSNQFNQEPKLFSILSNPFLKDSILSQTKSAIEIVDLDDQVPFIKQENQSDVSDAETGTAAKSSVLPSFTGDKDWNLFSIKDARLDDIDADIGTLEQSFEKPFFQFSHFDQPEQIELRDDSTCTLDELANKLTQCVYCERIFSIEDSSKQEGDEKPYCGTCDKMSASRIHLITDSPGPQGKNLKCLLCDTLFEEPGQLKQHICVTNMNGKRYNPCLKSICSNDDDFEESNSPENDFIIHYEDPLNGIKVLEPLSSCESPNSIVMHGEKADGNGAAVGESKWSELSKENLYKAKQIELKESDMKSGAGLVRPGGNEDDNEVMIIENVWGKSIKEDDGINTEKGKCIPADLIQSAPVGINIFQDDNLYNRNVFIIDGQPDQNISKYDALVNDLVKSYDSETSSTTKKNIDHENDSSFARRKNSNLCPSIKSKLNRTVLNKSRKLLRNRLKNPLQKALPKESGQDRSSDLRFKCRYCNKGFSVQGNLRKHIRIHTGEKPFKCSFCPTAFANPSNLTRHIRTHTGEKPYKCPHCDSRFRASSNLRSHQRTHFKSVQYKCNVCQEKFSLIGDYQSHLKSHQNQQIPNHFSVDSDNIIGRQINAENSLTNQKVPLVSNNQNPERQGFNFVTNDDNSNPNISDVDDPSLRLRWKEKEERIEKVQTTFLNDSFDFSNQFIQNLSKREGDSSLHQPDSWQEQESLEPIIPDSWKETLNPEDHDSKQMNRDNIVVIDLENNYLDSYGDPNPVVTTGFDHQVEHLSINKNQFSKKFSEKRCSENFDQNSKTPTSFNSNLNLESNNEITSDQTKIHSSKSRSISFKSLISSTISKSRPYRCVYCSKGFTVHCNLVKHIRIHTGEKPFACKDCGKAFANPSNLTRHLRTHTGERPYTCSLCSCTFRSSSNLNIHMNSHSSATGQIKCSFCDQVFSRKNELRIHLRMHIMDRKVKAHPFNFSGKKTNFVKSPNGGRILSSSSTMIPSFLRYRNPSRFAKQSHTLKNLIAGRTALHHKQKMLRNSRSITESSNNDPLKVDSFHLDSSEMISSKVISPKCPAGGSPSVEGKENTSEIVGFGSEMEHISLQHSTDAFANKIIEYNVGSKSLNTALDVAALNSEDVPNRLLTAKHESMTSQTSPGKDHSQIENETGLNKPVSNESVDCTGETATTNQLEESNNGKIASLSQNMLSPQTNLSPKIKFESENLSVLETADPIEVTTASTAATATVGFKTSKSSHKCRFCGRMFPSRCNLIKHVRTHTGEKPFRCKCCRAAFANPSNLTRHVRTHTGEKPYSCPHCSKTFRASSNLKQHLRTHREGTPYKCRFCNRNFFMFSNFKLHLRSHGKPGTNSKVTSSLDLPDPEPINYSNRNTQQNLTPTFSPADTTSMPVINDNSHNQLQWTESRKKADIIVVPTFRRRPRKYKCVYCEKTFNVSSNLTKHVRTHTGEKPFQCRFCPKAFANPSNLIRHERIHTGERPYLCPYCPQRFAASGNLKEHVRKHSVSDEPPIHLQSISERLMRTKKENTAKEKYSNSTTLQKDNLTASASADRKDSANLSPEDNSDNEGNYIIEVANQLNSSDQSFEKGGNSRNHVLSVDSETSSLALNRNEALSVISLDPLIRNSLKKPVAGSDSSNERHIKQEVLTQEKDFCSKSADTNNEETDKDEDYGEVQEIKDPTCEQNDFLASFNRNSMDSLNDERSTNTMEISGMAMDSVLCKKEIPNSVSPNPNSFENSFSRPHKEGSYQCQMCNLTFVHFYELNQHMEIHALSSEIEIKEEVGNDEEYSKNTLDYEARENSLGNAENENASFGGELYICKYGCRTFGSYAELNSHLKIHAEEDKVIINNAVYVDDDNFPQNNGQKRNSLILDSLSPQLQHISPATAGVTPSAEEFDLYGCGPFISSLDSDQHLMAELTQQPNIPATKSSVSSPQSQLETFKDIPITWPTRTNTQKPHRCPFCIKSFSKRSQLTKHIRTHTGETPHKCRYCGTGFANPSNLTRHIRTHTGEKPYKCPICKKAFGNSSNMKEHLKTHSKIPLYKCKYCQKKFSSFHSYKTHLKGHYKVFRSAETLKKGGSPISIIIDNNSNSSEEVVEIYEQTDDVFPLSPRTQTDIHNDERDKLGFSVSDLSISEQNEVCEMIKMNDATNGNGHSIVYLADTTEETEVVNETLASHYKPTVNQKQPEQLINLVDFYQSFTLSHQEDLSSSLNENQKSFQRNFVERSDTLAKTNQSKAFNHHSRQALRSHICKYCGKMFSIHSNLTKHIRTHTGEKPFKCHTCGVAFANPSNLTRHVRTHTGEKPYLCPHCSKSFRASSNLKVHLKMIHTQF